MLISCLLAVISWLNKQVTDQKLGVGGRVPPGVGVAGGRVPPGVGVGRGLPPGTGLRSSPASLFPPYTVGGVAVNNAYTGLANSQGMVRVCVCVCVCVCVILCIFPQALQSFLTSPSLTNNIISF